MKSQFTPIVLAAAASVLFGGLMLSGQNRNSVADIPFAFEASHVSLPAGHYTVAETSTDGLFRIYDSERHSVFITMAPQGVREPSKPSLTFLCDGSQRILSKLTMDSGTDYAVSKSSIEKDLNRRLDISAVVSVALSR